MSHHLLNFHTFVPTALKILANPVFQTDCYEYSDYLQNEQEKYDKMMKKAREKALKRAVELGALTAVSYTHLDVYKRQVFLYHYV